MVKPYLVDAAAPRMQMPSLQPQRRREDVTRVLVAAPASETARDLLTQLSAAGYAPMQAFDGPQALHSLLAVDGPSIIIVDEALPGEGGAELVRALRAHNPERYVYCVLLVDDPARGTLAGREAGADDCLTKPVDARELQAYLRGAERIANMERRLSQARDHFRAQARRDALTGLANRLEIMETMEREVCRAERQGSAIGVVMVDLDHFKRINDTYGHQVGDEVLREAAQRMQDAVRTYDVVGRYGGEEFMVVLADANARDTERVAERLRAALASTPIMTTAGPLTVSASLGTVSTGGRDPLPGEELVGRADAALYEAKAQGRNRVVAARTLEALPPAPVSPEALRPEASC